MNYEAYKKFYRLPPEMNMSWVTKEYLQRLPYGVALICETGTRL